MCTTRLSSTTLSLGNRQTFTEKVFCYVRHFSICSSLSNGDSHGWWHCQQLFVSTSVTAETVEDVFDLKDAGTAEMTVTGSGGIAGTVE